MRNIHDPKEYYAYKSTTEDSNNRSTCYGKGPTVGGWIVIGIVGYFFLHFLFSGAGLEAIDTLLGLGLLLYLFVNWITK